MLARKEHNFCPLSSLGWVGIYLPALHWAFAAAAVVVVFAAHPATIYRRRPLHYPLSFGGRHQSIWRKSDCRNASCITELKETSRTEAGDDHARVVANHGAAREAAIAMTGQKLNLVMREHASGVLVYKQRLQSGNASRVQFKALIPPSEDIVVALRGGWVARS